MNIQNANLIISAVKPAQYPATFVPEVALAGRSNVGKSSFINKLLGRKNLARTSSKPGKTATLNFYGVDNSFNFVDLPGYGYAEKSMAERQKWALMINKYLETRPQLKSVILLVDSRHRPTKDDKVMYQWIKARFGEVTVIATKYDKLPKTKGAEHIEEIKETLGVDQSDTVIAFSGETGHGKEEAWQEILRLTQST